MRVAIGAVAGTLGGPATYAVELVAALARTQPQSDYLVLTDRPDLFDEFAATVELPLGSAWEQPLWDHKRVAGALGRERVDVYHATKGILPRWLRTPAVVTIHDLAVKVMPETFSRAQRLHLRLETPASVRRAAAVITDSRSSAADLARFYPRSAAKTEVIALAAPRSLRPASQEQIERWRAEHAIDGPALGYLGTLQPRKNIDVLARAFLRAAGSKPWRLLIAGRMRPGYRPQCLGWGDERICYLGEIDDDQVPAFLGALSCMVSPSSYEGFGLSFIEAMACGCPVIGVANSSVPEVVGDAGVLVSEVDVPALADAIERVVVDPALTLDLSRRGVERAALFSWRETARLTHAVYARVAGAAA